MVEYKRVIDKRIDYDYKTIDINLNLRVQIMNPVKKTTNQVF